MFRRQLLRQGRLVSDLVSKPKSAVHRATFSQISSPASLRTTSAYSQGLSQRRWQSTETEKKEETPAATESKPEDAVKEDAAKAELEKKNKEIAELKDKYLRSVADFRNLQDRTKRDMDAAKAFAIQRFSTDLLDSIDNLDRALEAVPKAALGQSSPTEASTSTTSNTSSADPNVAAPSESTPAPSKPNQDLLNLYSGLKMTSEIMLNVLKKHGLERFDPLEREGARFDPNKDEATFFTKVDGKEDGTVFYTQSKGFTLNGRVVRAAKVGVVKNN